MNTKRVYTPELRRRVESFIRSRVYAGFTRKDIEDRFGISAEKLWLRTGFRRERYFAEQLVREGKKYLRRGYSAKWVARKMGYRDDHYAGMFKRVCGMTPYQWQKARGIKRRKRSKVIDKIS